MARRKARRAKIKGHKKLSVGRLIRKLREEQGLKQADLARLAGYKSQMSISRIESGAVGFPYPKAPLFADALGVERSEFYRLCIEGTQAPKPPPAWAGLTKGCRIPPDIARRFLARERGSDFWNVVREFMEFVDGRGQSI
ncbi:MAG: helix-turn-helix transcriptional regulator [Bdellovibrionota bacterium]